VNRHHLFMVHEQQTWLIKPDFEYAIGGALYAESAPVAEVLGRFEELANAG
jgi:hypothetical protein